MTSERLRFPALVGGPLDGRTVPYDIEDGTVLDLPHPRGDREDSTDTVRYVREVIILGGLVVDVFLYVSPDGHHAMLSDATAAIARRGCR